MKVILQLVIDPRSPPASSTTKRFQLPFGLPAKDDRVGVACVTEPGPGAGKSSVAPTLVGLNVPVTSVPGKTAPASLNVILIPLISVPPPASDINTTLVPEGDCNNISISPGKVCVIPLIVTEATVTPTGGKPLTLMADG